MSDLSRSRYNLDPVREYLITLVKETNWSTRPDLSEVGAFWLHRNNMTLRFTHSEAAIYNNLLKEAVKEYAPDGDLSEKALDTALKDAVFAVVGDTEPSRDEASMRIEQALTQFKRSLEASSQSFECWIEVEGIDAKTLPACFGPTRFSELDNTYLDILRDTVETKHTVQIKEKLEFIDQQLISEIAGRIAAIQTVSARDIDAARHLGKQEVQLTIDCLNFLGELVPYNHGKLTIPKGRSQVASSVLVTIAANGSYNYSPEQKVPWTYSFDRLHALSAPLAEVVVRVEKLREKSELTQVEKLLLQAIRWAGRASASELPENRFLYSMVSLECLVLPEREGPLSRQLARRIAGVLSRTPDFRSEIMEETRRLYKLRSEFVHEGRLEVSEDDIARVQTYAIEVICRMLANDEVGNLQTSKDLQEYFDKLSGT